MADNDWTRAAPGTLQIGVKIHQDGEAVLDPAIILDFDPEVFEVTIDPVTRRATIGLIGGGGGGGGGGAGGWT